MRRLVWLGCLPLLAAGVGCSNRPLVGLMDCFFPSKGASRPPGDLPRPTDRDPLPPVDGFNPAPPADGFRRGDLPPLGAPIAPDGGQPLRKDDAPWTREPAPGALPLPGGGRN